MVQLTIRNVPEDIAQRLKRLSQEEETSVNAVVLEILRRAVGAEERRQRLERYATWTREDLEEFEAALSAQRVIDDRLWS